MSEEQKDDLSLILAASLTLLALIIGFSFSMATNRCDQRKNFEEAEANAIGTEYLRADLLPSADAARVRKLLSDYTNQRILFYTNTDDAQRARIDERVNQLEADLWGCSPWTSCCTADARYRPRARRHERCYQLARLYPGGYWNRILQPPGISWQPLRCAATCCSAIGCKRQASSLSCCRWSFRFHCF
jgi:hypothetical protein